MTANKQLQLELDDATSKGVYSNFAVIVHNQNEFMIDFALIHPSKAKVVSRVITSPSHMKRFYKVLGENLAQYEKTFGQIKDTQGPEQTIDIKLSNN
jgi:Protein of unknown function (DUF3467)